MKKILFLSLLITVIWNCRAQLPPANPIKVNRAPSSITVKDKRLWADSNFRVPVGSDTSMNHGLDSLGQLYYRYPDSTFWGRVGNGTRNIWMQFYLTRDTIKTLATQWYALQHGGGGGGTGTVTTFSAGTLSPLFTTNVATATTTPNLTFSLTNAGAYTILGNNTGSPAPPTYFSPSLTGTLFAGQGQSFYVLHGNGTPGNPLTWRAVDQASDVTGVLGTANGGTNFATSAAHKFFGNFTGSTVAMTASTPVLASADFGSQGSTHTYLQGGNPPSWSAISLTADVSGVLPIANGGDGSATTNAHNFFGNFTATTPLAPAFGKPLLAADFLGPQGTAVQVLHGNATANGPMAWGAVNLPSDVTGNLPIANLANGIAGGAGSATYLRGDNTWATPPGTSYTFAKSIVNTAGTVTLVNDSTSIPAGWYYGTNLSVPRLGYYNLATATTDTLVIKGTILNFISGGATNPDTLTMADAPANKVLGNNTGSTAPPLYFQPLLNSALFANQGTLVNNLLHANPSGNLTWSKADLANDVTGNLDHTHLNSGTNADASHVWAGNDTWITPVLSVANQTPSVNTLNFGGVYSTQTTTQALLRVLSSPSPGDAGGNEQVGITISNLNANEVQIKNNAYDLYGAINIATTDATVTLGHHFVVANNNTAILMTVEVVAIGPSGSWSTIRQMSAYKNNSGTCTLGSENTVKTGEALGSGMSVGGVTWAISANEPEVRVTGIAATNITWKVIYKSVKIIPGS